MKGAKRKNCNTTQYRWIRGIVAMQLETRVQHRNELVEMVLLWASHKNVTEEIERQKNHERAIGLLFFLRFHLVRAVIEYGGA